MGVPQEQLAIVGGGAGIGYLAGKKMTQILSRNESLANRDTEIDPAVGSDLEEAGETW